MDFDSTVPAIATHCSLGTATMRPSVFGNCPIRVDSHFCRAHPYMDKPKLIRHQAREVLKRVAAGEPQLLTRQLNSGDRRITRC
jgi:hypothetical protein